jgi:hypothetical protein
VGDTLARLAAFQSFYFVAVLWPERFRGGFAFGAGASAGLSRDEVRPAIKMWPIRAIVNPSGCVFFWQCGVSAIGSAAAQWRLGARMR